MAKKLYLGAGNSSRECSKLYIGESSIARKIIKGYIGVNGSARQFYPLYKWKRYSVNSTSTLDKTNYGMITYYVSSSGATNRYLPAYESSLRATPSGIFVLGVSWIDALYNFDIIFSYQYSINGQTVTNMWDMSNSVNQTYSTLYAFVPQTGGGKRMERTMPSIYIYKSDIDLDWLILRRCVFRFQKRISRQRNFRFLLVRI